MDLDQDFFDKLAKNIGNEVSKAVENKFKCVADEQMDLIRANQEWVEQLKEYQNDGAVSNISERYTSIK